MKLQWRFQGSSNGISKHFAKCDGLEAVIVDYYGESQSFSIVAVGNILDTANRTIVCSDIETKGLANTKKIVLEYMALLSSGVPLPKRLTSSDKITYKIENSPLFKTSSGLTIKGYTIGSIYKTEDESIYLKLHTIANTGKQIAGVTPKMILNFIDIVSGEFHSLTVSECNTIKLIKVA